MRNVLYQNAMPLDFPFSVNFQYENSRVFTVEKLQMLGKSYEGQDEEDENENGYIVVEILTSIRDFESITDAAARARPKLLVILSLLSLLCDKAFAPFMSPYGGSRVANHLGEPGDTCLVVDGDDLTGELAKILETLNGANEARKRLIYSLMDRWRKACYMQEQSEESMEFDDEVLISYFHVLELLATDYYGALKSKIKGQVSSFLNDVYQGSMLFEGDYLKAATDAKKALTEALVFEDVPVAGKILFSLNELHITGSRFKYLLSSLVKDRNGVAHGRIVYQDKIIFPVPQFFPNAKMNDYSLNTLKYLTAHAICTYTGSDRYKAEWESQDAYLVPTPEEVKAFVADKRYEGLSNADFAAGAVDGVNVGAISMYMVDKKISSNDGLVILAGYLKSVSEESDQIGQVVLGAALMADVADEEQLAQCEHILIAASNNGWHMFSDMRDVLSFLEYNGFQPKHLEQMIHDRKLR